MALALSWPVPVLLRDPTAFAVWVTEIGQKTGMLPIAHQSRSVLGLALPVLVLPWPVALFAGIALPFMRSPPGRLAVEIGGGLVPLVLGSSERGDVEYLGCGQTELLHPVSAWSGAARGHGLDSHEPERPRLCPVGVVPAWRVDCWGFSG